MNRKLGLASSLGDRTIIIVSNRGPVSFYGSGGDYEARRGSGGLVTAMSGVCRDAGARWISAAMTPADREIAEQKRSLAYPKDNPLYTVRLVDIPEKVYEPYYSVISNPLIWFVFHHLWDLADHPEINRSTITAWRGGYLEANKLLANEAIDEARKVENPVIMLQDYHLFAAARFIKEALPAALVTHFNHIPWPEPDYFKVLPEEIRFGLIEGMLHADILGFQTAAYARAFLDCCETISEYAVERGAGAVCMPDGRKVYTRTYPISIEPDELLEMAVGKDVLEHEGRIEDSNKNTKLIVRTDRADLSKNIVRGFKSYDLMLAEHPELKGKVRFLAFLYPTRDTLPEYVDYRRKIEETVAVINRRHGTTGWEPIHLRIEDNYPESVAALKLYDVLLVNPIFDGMNLVAKEGPLVNRKNGVLVLSENTGSHCELGEAALTVNPFDLGETAQALYRALTLPEDERRARAEWLKSIVERNDAAKWIYHQLEDLQELTGSSKVIEKIPAFREDSSS